MDKRQYVQDKITKYTLAYCLSSTITHFFPAEFDEGEALKQLIEAEKQLLWNNFPQDLVVLAHAASSIAANYDLVVNEFDGAATPVLKGQPVSGKTAALKAVMSVFGQQHFTSETREQTDSSWLKDKN